MTVNCNRLRRVGIASVVMALVGGLGAACTAEPQKTAETDAPSKRVSESAPPSEAHSRRPVAIVLFSGRVAFPHVTLTTWGACPFVIERVRRVDRSTLLVVGRESKSGCEPTHTRHVTTKRLKRMHATGGETIDRVTVVGELPSYRVEARVRRSPIA